MERFQVTQLAVICFLETGQESLAFYLHKTSILSCYKSVACLEYCKITPSMQNFTLLFRMQSSEFHVAYLKTS